MKESITQTWPLKKLSNYYDIIIPAMMAAEKYEILFLP